MPISVRRGGGSSPATIVERLRDRHFFVQARETTQAAGLLSDDSEQELYLQNQE